MQPYFLPYLPYFQLINSVDKFIIYDDVNYIKSGWINRNNILINQKASMFTVPLIKASSFSKINDLQIDLYLFNFWKKKFIKSINQYYSKAPYFNEVFEVINRILIVEDNHTISNFVVKALKEVVNYLQINTIIVESSSIYNNSHLKSYQRVIDICIQESATVYINPIGGLLLYDKFIFKQSSLELSFLKSNNYIYQQFTDDFVPLLSIIDVLMFNSVDSFKFILNNFELI